jgi:pimeloyl-ACP methyl ester carboxylesterase
MNRRQLWHYVRRIWIALGLSATVVFIGWSLIAFRASGDAQVATQSDSAVTILHVDGIWSFMPRRGAPAASPALIFFPGALVSPLAYAPLVRAAAIAGFAAYIVELPRRGAMGGADDPALEQRFERLLAQPGTPRRWVIAGHSRGAVVAAQLAATQRAGFSGLVLIGTTHPRDVDLSTLTTPVTKIVGTRDGIATPADVEANRAKLPVATQWVWVQGGNHSQFGWYGFQPGDRRASVSSVVQHTIMIRAVLDMLARVSTAPPAS